MSGPKTSRYTLTAEQRRILREQQKKERRIKEEKIKVKHKISELYGLSARLKEPFEKAQELNKRTGKETEFIEKVEKIETMIEHAIQVMPKASELDDITIIEKHHNALESCLKSIGQQMASLRDHAEQIELQLKEDINDSIDKGFNLSFENIQFNQHEEELKALAEEQVIRLKSLRSESILTKELLHEINSTINRIQQIQDIDFMKNYAAITITHLDKKCKQYLNDYEIHSKRFLELYARYKAICEMLTITEKNYSFSVESITELEQEIDKLEMQLIENQEQEYISKCIDEVMEEMGYELLGNRMVTKRNGKSFRNELYSFTEGTAVNITYASDGKITMELGGIDNEDRMPMNDETDRLCEDMKTFCQDFSEIENKLMLKGVVSFQKISILPPSVEYAQIINVKDYKMNVDVNKFKTVNEKRKDKKHKVMRMG